MSIPQRAGRGTAVSLTPVALEHDSRALRVALTLAEAGFRSIAVEAQPSRRGFRPDGIELCSPAASGIDPGAAARRGGRSRRLIAALREGRGGAIGEWALYLAFRADDRRRHCAAIRRVLPPADLYYLHSFELYRAVAPLAAGCGARVVYDAHDFYRGIEPPEVRRSFDRRRMRPFLDRLEDRVLADADAVVTVSEGVARLIERVSGRRVAIIRNCHDGRRDRAPAADLRARLRLTQADRLCVVVGNYKPGMALRVAAASMALLPPRFHLAFVGRGYERADPGGIDAGPSGRIHLGPAASADEIVETIRSADLGLVLYEPISVNYRYALPNGFFQVVAAGLPVIRAPLPEIEAVIGTHRIGRCLAALTPEALAAAILHAEQNAAGLRAGAVALGRELRWENEARRLLRLIDDLMPERAPVAAAG